MQATFTLQTDDRVLHKTPGSFDVSVWELFWPLVQGAALVVAPSGMEKDASQLRALITKQKVSVLHFVPPMLRVFLDTGGFQHHPRLVICSGEALPVDLVQQFHRHSSAELHNLYGPTEAAIDVSHYRTSPTAMPRDIPIGKAVRNVSLWVLDDNVQPLVAGFMGALYIGGRQLARGYAGQPRQTAAQFIPNPFARRPGQRLYRTGDLARRNARGELLFLGRQDHQVKIRGQRVELGEIEACLSHHPAINSSLVVYRVTGQGEGRLVAYIQPNSASVATDGVSPVEQVFHNDQLEQQLQSHLLTHLPAVMQPNQWVFLQQFPYKSNGKIDRQALPLPAPAVRTTKVVVAPDHPLEVEVLATWRELLDRKTICVNDDFFKLGGSSIAAVRLAYKLEQRWQRPVPLDWVFTHTTISSFVAKVRGSLANLGPRLVRLNQTNHPSPWFFFYPLGDQIHWYREIGRAFEHIAPVYALSPESKDGSQGNLSQQAKALVDCLSEFYPEGPLYLGGWSFGGMLAFAVAEECVSRGRLPRAVTLIDSVYPKQASVATSLNLLNRFLADWLSAAEWQNLQTSVETGPDYPARLLRAAHDLLTQQPDHSTLPALSWFETAFQRFRDQWQAVVSHPFNGNYPGAVTLIRASETVDRVQKNRSMAEAFPWARWCTRPIRTLDIAGNHRTILELDQVQQWSTSLLEAN